MRGSSREPRCHIAFEPIRKSFLGRGHGKIDIARVAVGDLRVRLARRRLDVIEILAADRLDEFTVDEILNSGRFSAHRIEGN